MIDFSSTGCYTNTSCNTSELLLSNISDHAAYRGAIMVSEGVRVLSAPAHKSSFDETEQYSSSRRVRAEDG